MLDSVGGVITIGAFLLLFIVFGLYAHRRTATDTPSENDSHECDCRPEILDVPLVPIADVLQPWAGIMPLSAQYPYDERLHERANIQVNTIIIMPSRHKPNTGFINFALGKTLIPRRKRIPGS